MRSTPDQLIAQAQTGDRVALARLLQYCQPDARRYARKMCLAGHVEDAVQESLLLVALRLNSLKAVAAFSGWLFTIIKRECQKFFSRQLQPLTDEILEARFEHKTDFDLQLDLVAALESLPQHYLRIILLRDFEELSILEISQRLGENVPAIKSRLHRARELVREYLNAE